jgi:hypothetical protein
MFPKLKRPLGSYFAPEVFGRWITGLGGRRFILTLIVQFMTGSLAYHELIDGNIYRDVVLATSAVFIASDTYQKVKQKTSETTVEVAEITGEAPVTIDGASAPIKVELSTAPGESLGHPQDRH